MLRNVALGCSLFGLLAGGVIQCFAETPVLLRDFISTPDLVTEAEAAIKNLEEVLRDKVGYTPNKIATEAAVLAVVSQAIIEYQDKTDWKASAPDLRDAAINIASTENYETAVMALSEIQAAHKGKKGTAVSKFDWNDLATPRDVMNAINRRFGALRRATRNLPDDTTIPARDARIVALLSLATHAHSKLLRNPAHIPKWHHLSLETHESMAKLADELKAKNSQGSKDAYFRAARSCADCHAGL